MGGNILKCQCRQAPREGALKGVGYDADENEGNRAGPYRVCRAGQRVAGWQGVAGQLGSMIEWKLLLQLLHLGTQHLILLSYWLASLITKPGSP
jgi:hypothetical protein